MNNIEIIELLIDHDTRIRMDEHKITMNVLGFFDENFYHNHITDSEKGTCLKYGVQIGIGHLDGKSIALGVMDFTFM